MKTKLSVMHCLCIPALLGLGLAAQTALAQPKTLFDCRSSKYGVILLNHQDPQLTETTVVMSITAGSPGQVLATITKHDLLFNAMFDVTFSGLSETKDKDIRYVRLTFADFDANARVLNAVLTLERKKGDERVNLQCQRDPSVPLPR